jgi:hypothetical protein
MVYHKEYLNAYIDLLQIHDWSYDYSDDHSKLTRGFEQKSQLEAYAKDLDPTYKVWNEHAPEGFKKQIFLQD